MYVVLTSETPVELSFVFVTRFTSVSNVNVLPVEFRMF
jgi:hypothetical protein